MKKKVEPKPTKVSKHHVPYMFQQKSVNLHPLTGMSTQGVRQYQPSSYVMGHSSVLSTSASQPVLQSQTYTPHTHGGVLDMGTVRSDRASSFQTADSFGSMGEGGLSTDGQAVYEIDHSFVSPEPQPVPNPAELAAKQAVNNNRAAAVKSAPASFSGDGSRITITGFSTAVGATAAAPPQYQHLEDDTDFQWLMASGPTAAIGQEAKGHSPGRARSALPTMRLTSPLHGGSPSHAHPRANSAAAHTMNKTRLGSASATIKDIHAVDAIHERLVLGWIDRDLVDHLEDTELEEEDVAEENPPPEAETAEDDDQVGFEDEGNDRLSPPKPSPKAEEDFWKSAGSARLGTSSKRHVVALTRGSLLALIDDHRHDTSVKHSKEDSVDFFSAASAAAAAVGLEGMADNLLLNRPKDLDGGMAADSADDDEVVSVSPQGSRPTSPNERRPYSAKEPSVRRSAPASSGVGTGAVDWLGAFAEQSAEVFASSVRSAKLRRCRTVGGSVPDGRGISTKGGISSKKVNATGVSVRIEDYLDGIVDVSEADDDVPFRTASPTRRKSINHALEELTVTKTASGKVKYFSYLYKAMKKRARSAGGSSSKYDSADEAEAVVMDPFEAARPPRPTSNPNIMSALAVGMRSELPPKPTVDLERYVSPVANGPVWGQISNYSTRPDARPHSRSRRSTPHSPNTAQPPPPLSGSMVTGSGGDGSLGIAEGTGTNRLGSTARGKKKVIRGWVKKFAFEGEYLKSPFLFHMTVDRHKEKYGDADRKRRLAAERAAAAAAVTASAGEGASQPASPQSSPKATTKQRTKVSPLKPKGKSTLLTSDSVHPSFNTTLGRPKHSHHRQNSWALDDDPSDFNSAARRPLSLTRQSTSEGSGDQYSADFEGSGGNSSSRSHLLSRQGTQDHPEGGDWPTGNSARPASQEAFERDIRNGLNLLSRQNSVAGAGMLTRQSSLAAVGQQTQQQQQPLTGVAKGLSDLQALVDSINSVLVRPPPLRLSRPPDVFDRGMSGALGTGSPLSRSHTNTNLESEGTPTSPGQLSRGGSFKRVPSNPHTARSHTSSVSSTQRAITAAAEGMYASTDEGPLRPNTRGDGLSRVSFAPSPTPSAPPLLSESVLKYVPSERRGSLSPAEGLGGPPVFDGVSAALARRKSMAAMASEKSATSNIDTLVSARRTSFMGAAPLVSIQAQRQESRPLMGSLDSAINNPLMDEYYDAEEGLQDTGVIIANLHADPLYRILRAEVERALSQHQAQSMEATMLQGQVTRPQSSHVVSATAPQTSHRAASARPTCSATGLSNYKTRDLGHTISPTDLKVLGSFISLPPAAWVTCRVVYFLLMSFYECVPRVSRHFEYRSYMAAEPLWEALEAQITERQLCMEEVELQYSWPLLQSLFTRFPVLTMKVLQIIELGIPESDGLDGRPKCPQFLPTIFFDAFPPTKLIYLRDLIKQSMGLFQASELLLVVPVASQLCDWAKRVIARVYASCISRLRATQSNAKKLTSVLHSTVPLHVHSEDDEEGLAVWERKEAPPPLLLPPNLKFAIAVEDALEESSMFALHSLDSFTALNNSQTGPLPAMSISHTLEKGLNLVKPSDHLDLLLMLPSAADVSMQVSIAAGGGSQFEEYGSLANSLEGYSSLQKLQRDWLLTKFSYERHLQQFAASPLHRVVLLPPASTPPGEASFLSEHSQQELDIQRSMEDFAEEQNGTHQHSNQVDTARLGQDGRVHPVLRHCLTATGSGTPFLPVYSSSDGTGAQGEGNSKPEADVLIARMREGRLPKLLAGKGPNEQDNGPARVRFSLVLVDDLAPTLRRPLSPFSTSVAALHEKMASTIHQAVASTVGPNRFVITIADTPHSWLAFQMVCRIAKPSDSITLVHIPVICPPFGRKIGPESNEGGSRNAEKHAYFTLQEYDHQYRRCARRIEHLVSVYKNAGYNLYVDTIPPFQEEMRRQLVYMQRKNYFHAQLVERQREARLKRVPPPPSPVSSTSPPPTCSPPRAANKVGHGTRLASMKGLSAKSATWEVPAPVSDNSLETNIAVRLFVQNQHTYHLATRILTLARKLEASFLVLGVGSTDIAQVITAPPAPAHFGDPVVTRNLNFPYSAVVPDNACPHDALDALMSARKALRCQGKAVPEPGYWLDEFTRYAEQKVDLAEMVLHQYGHQQRTGSTDKHSRHHHQEDHAHHRFSFLLSNCDSLK